MTNEQLKSEIAYLKDSARDRSSNPAGIANKLSSAAAIIAWLAEQEIARQTPKMDFGSAHPLPGLKKDGK